MNGIQSCFQRRETKYLLTQEQYEAMRAGMQDYMTPDVYGHYRIGNVYYDTPDYRLIRASLEKPVYKEKLRMRSYGVPGSGDRVFVELKKKFDGVVYKRRVTMQVQDAALWLYGARRGDGSQISREIDWFLRFYQPKPAVFIGYDREAYAAADGGELRITFDTELCARDADVDLRLGSHGAPLLPEGIYLMEIKIPGAAPLWLSRLLSENGIFPTSYSKYGAYYKQFVLGGKKAEAAKKEVLLSA